MGASVVKQWWRGVPQVRFGSGEDSPSDPSPVVTYYLIIVPAVVLVVFGLLMGFSASAVTNIAKGANPYLAFLRPLGIIVMGVILAAIAQMVPERLWWWISGWVLLAGLAFQALVLTPLGATEGGNTNWVHIPGVPVLIQPSEFLKLTLALFLGRTLTRRTAEIRNWRQMLVTVGAPVLVCLLFVMFGHDLGTAIVMAACALGAMWVAGLPGKWFAVMGFTALPILVYLVFQNPTRLARVLQVIPGMGTPTSTSEPTQTDHALWALGAGGWTGLGPGASREKWNYLPAAHTDFILAIIGEELGLLGTCAVLLCLGLLVWGMVRVCQNHSSPYARVVTGAIACWIGVQGLINVMSVTGLGPVIGVPLPLVSYGGSSLLFTALAVGVVASFARSDAGMRMWGRPDESSAGRDPRRTPRRRSAHHAPRTTRHITRPTSEVHP